MFSLGDFVVFRIGLPQEGTAERVLLCCVVLQLAELSFLQISEDGRLSILGTQEMDTGEYECMATNDAGTATATLELDVGCETCLLLAYV